jgi:hypothetical protein
MKNIDSFNLKWIIALTVLLIITLGHLIYVIENSRYKKIKFKKRNTYLVRWFGKKYLVEKHNYIYATSNLFISFMLLGAITVMTFMDCDLKKDLGFVLLPFAFLSILFRRYEAKVRMKEMKGK